MSVSALSQKALQSGLFPLVTARRLHNVVGECFAPRFLRSPGVASGLKRLAASLPKQEFNQLLFLHTARANLVFADFVRDVYWARLRRGAGLADARGCTRLCLECRPRRTHARIRWSDTTIKRVASYVLGCCADYGLLAHATRGPRRIQPLASLSKGRGLLGL